MKLKVRKSWKSSSWSLSSLSSSNCFFNMPDCHMVCSKASSFGSIPWLPKASTNMWHDSKYFCWFFVLIFCRHLLASYAMRKNRSLDGMCWYAAAAAASLLESHPLVSLVSLVSFSFLFSRVAHSTGAKLFSPAIAADVTSVSDSSNDSLSVNLAKLMTNRCQADAGCLDTMANPNCSQQVARWCKALATWALMSGAKCRRR